MHNSAWEALLRHIPAEQHNQFCLVTANGMEIAVQSFLRIERELVIVKGRLSGSQEQGRVFFIPYANIDSLGTSQPVKDTDFNETFGSLEFPSEPIPEPAPAEAAPANGNGYAPSARPTIRSEVLERFRNNRGNAPSSSANLPRPS
jgi:hypothetical protein